MLAAYLVALPWILGPLIAWWRVRDSRSLADEPADAPRGAPLVSVIVPARNEARNIEACLASVRAADGPRLEIIVVDDASTDGTGTLARHAAAGDDRVRVIDAPPLPAGWFGKQWACATAAATARGDVLLFTDADTRHGADLVPRAMSYMTRIRADLLSVAGAQELVTWWERVVQPQVFGMLVNWIGGTEGVTNARRAEAVLANGQCFFMTRTAYDAVGGHAGVRHTVAEDVMIAQHAFRGGYKVGLVLGIDQLSTRMYTSLDEIVRGWGKNVYAGGRMVLPAGPVRAVYPVALLLAPLYSLAPPLLFLRGLLGFGSPTVALGGAVALGCMILWWSLVYRWLRLPVWYAALYPIGALVQLWIFIVAIVRGQRVEWKGRTYTAG